MAARAKKDDEGKVEETDAGEEPRAEGRARAKSGGERDVLAALIEGLLELHPGLEIVDRELALDGGARADLAAVDPSGRLTLVQLAGEDTDRAALEALDALKALRSELEVLARHLGGRVRRDRGARLFVVSARSDVRLAERLDALADVVVYGMRTVTSAAGTGTYLVPMRPDSEPASAAGVAAFLAALPARLEPLGSSLVERMARLDEEVSAVADATTLVWRLAGEVLARVERIDERLEASVAPAHETFPLRGAEDLERLVEEALTRLVEVLGLTRTERTEVGPRPVREPDEPLLTPEEIAAFRE